jgi:pimeloyl-ACP methyl ester carboxylesterase
VRICLLLAVMLAGLTTLSDKAHASHIYLLKGLANIFSTGLDVLDEELTRRGYSATVHSYTDYESLAADAAALERAGKGPIIIMGHSLGADAAIYMAEKMNQLHAPVALVVCFGPTHDLAAPPNVSQVINYYTGGAVVSRGPGFGGSLSNVDFDKTPGINHLNIEKNEHLHNLVIARVQGIVGHAKAAAAPAPAQ